MIQRNQKQRKRLKWGGVSVAITTKIHIFKKYLNLVWL